MTALREHYVEAFIPDDSSCGYGWQCFTCGMERDGYETFTDAEEAGERHANAAANVGQVAR